MPITWKNVGSISPASGVSALMEQARTGVDSAFTGLETILANEQTRRNDNRQTRLDNNATTLKKFFSSLTTPEAIQAARDSGQVDDLVNTLQRAGGLDRSIDPFAMGREALTRARQDVTAANDFTQQQAKQAGQLRYDELTALNLKDSAAAEAYLNEGDNRNILLKGGFLDDAAKDLDARGQELVSRDRETDAYNSKQAAGDAVLQALQNEDIGAGEAELRKALAENGVQGKDAVAAFGTYRNTANTLYNPNAQEQLAIDAQLKTLNNEIENGIVDSTGDVVTKGNVHYTNELAVIDDQMKQLSPLITGDLFPTNADNLTFGNATYEIQDTDNYSGWSLLSPVGFGIELFNDMTTDSTARNLTDFAKEADKIVQDKKLINMSGAQVVQQAMRLASEGMTGDPENPPKLKMSKVRNLLEAAAVDLAKQQQRYTALMSSRTKAKNEQTRLKESGIKRESGILLNRGQVRQPEQPLPRGSYPFLR